jgi:hypothetical protein
VVLGKIPGRVRIRVGDGLDQLPVSCDHLWHLQFCGRHEPEQRAGLALQADLRTGQAN